MNRRLLFLFAVLLAWTAGTGAARAHELQTAYLEVDEAGPGLYHVLWKVPALANFRDNIQPSFPAGAKIVSPIIRYQGGKTVVERYDLSYPGGLTGQTLTLTGPAAIIGDVLVRFVRADGSTQILRLNPATPSVIIPAQQTWYDRGGLFVVEGVRHILMGVDHLLFVLGLMLIVRDRWMLVKTVTAFTLAHSITLAIATLGYASAPIPPLNAAIALSILFLGPEIMRVRAGETSLTIRHPWVVAFAFGLLHGFGFASGLTTLGLSPGEIPLALVSFNVGVELGQLFFLSIILLLEQAFRVLEIHWPRWATYVPPYTVGTLGAYWTISRTIAMFAGS
jgi:hydrogenase/urease accessory protein HupE